LRRRAKLRQEFLAEDATTARCATRPAQPFSIISVTPATLCGTHMRTPP